MSPCSEISKWCILVWVFVHLLCRGYNGPYVYWSMSLCFLENWSEFFLICLSSFSLFFSLSAYLTCLLVMCWTFQTDSRFFFFLFFCILIFHLLTLSSGYNFGVHFLILMFQSFWNFYFCYILNFQKFFFIFWTFICNSMLFLFQRSKIFIYLSVIRLFVFSTACIVAISWILCVIVLVCFLC